MKILVVGESGTWFDKHIVGSLVALGHDVTVFHYGPSVGQFYPWRRREERVEKNRRLGELIRRLAHEVGLDLIFAYVYDDFLSISTARLIEKLGIPAVNLNVDMTTQWYRQCRTASYFTAMLCSHRENMDRLRQYSKEALYFPMAARRPDTPPAVDAGFPNVEASVVFVGTVAPERAVVLSELSRAGLPLAVFGRWHVPGEGMKGMDRIEKLIRDAYSYLVPKYEAEGWSTIAAQFSRHQGARDFALEEFMRPRVPESRMPAVFRQSGVNLGINRMSGMSGSLPGKAQMKLRDFEVPAAGGFYLTEHSPGYGDLFVEGEHFISWETTDDLIERCRHYLTHPDERRSISAAAQEHCLRFHLWEHRFEMLFRHLGLGHEVDPAVA